MAETSYTGMYRGIVVDCNDPQRRGRVRVFVYTVHRRRPGGDMGRNPDYRDITTEDFFPEGRRAVNIGISASGNISNQFSLTGLPAHHRWNWLPWAERQDAPGGKQHGSFPNLDPGDLVIVQFEHGNPQYPSVVGRWISRAEGFGDLQGDTQYDYLEHREDWIKSDRFGNSIKLSSAFHDPGVTIQSGYAYVRCSLADESVNIGSIGPFRVDSASIHMNSANMLVGTGTDVYLEACGPPRPSGDGQLLPEQVGEGGSGGLEGTTYENLQLWAVASLSSTDTAVVYGGNEIFMGQHPSYTYRSEDGEASSDENVVEMLQSHRVYITPRFLQLGVSHRGSRRAFAPNAPDPNPYDDTVLRFMPTDVIRMEAQHFIEIRAKPVFYSPGQADEFNENLTARKFDVTKIPFNDGIRAREQENGDSVLNLLSLGYAQMGARKGIAIGQFLEVTHQLCFLDKKEDWGPRRPVQSGTVAVMGQNIAFGRPTPNCRINVEGNDAEFYVQSNVYSMSGDNAAPENQLYLPTLRTEIWGKEYVAICTDRAEFATCLAEETEGNLYIGLPNILQLAEGDIMVNAKGNLYISALKNVKMERVLGLMKKVILAQDGGSDGTNTTPATWTYTVTSPWCENSVLGTAMTPEFPRPAVGKMTPATEGLGYFDDSDPPEFVLSIAYETLGGAKECGGE